MFNPALLLVPILTTQQQNPGFEAFRNKPVPQFILTTIDGKKITNRSLKGKMVLFDFWATWCGPCKMASPAIQKLQSKYGSKGLVVIGADTYENAPGPQLARQYKAEHKYTYTFTYENDGLARSLKIDSIPAFALVDKNGIVRIAASGLPMEGPDFLYKALARQIDRLEK